MAMGTNNYAMWLFPTKPRYMKMDYHEPVFSYEELIEKEIKPKFKV